MNTSPRVRYLPMNEEIPPGWRLDRHTWVGRNGMNEQWYDVGREGAASITMRAKVIVPTRNNRKRLDRGEDTALVQQIKNSLASKEQTGVTVLPRS